MSQTTPLNPSQRRENSQYHLNFPLNLTNTAFSLQDLRSILLSVIPCGTSFYIVQGDWNNPAGLGTYIKSETPEKRFIQIFSEQGTCSGLMNELLPDMTTTILPLNKRQ